MVGEVNFTTSYSVGGQNSIVIIMPCYWLVGPGFKMQWVEKIFSPYLSRPAMVPNHPSLQWVLDFCTCSKVALIMHPLLVPRVKVGRAVPLNFPYAAMA